MEQSKVASEKLKKCPNLKELMMVLQGLVNNLQKFFGILLVWLIIWCLFSLNKEIW
jgi:hypothetical protein